MGDRVTKPGQPGLARANRLKKALESGPPPAFVLPEIDPRTAQNSIPPKSARSSPLLDAFNRYPENANTRRPLLEHISEASPGALPIGDLDHRQLRDNETFVELF